MRRSLALSMLMACAVTGPAFAGGLNPQPFPPKMKPDSDVALADGSTAHVSADGNHLTTLKSGKMTALPPGPCKLKNGTLLTIGDDGLVKNIGSTTGGAGAGKMTNQVH